ncbi:MAG: sigma factor [Gammaproteobacteria bacterium]
MTNPALHVLTYDAQDHTTLRYASLVNQVASYLINKLPPSVDIDDLIQSGMIGLLEASKNYDPSRSLSDLG